MEPIEPIPLREIEAARDRVAGAAVRTPLVPLDFSSAGSDPHGRSLGSGAVAAEPSPAGRSPARHRGRRVWLKLECLQPIGSFKIRGAANAMALADPADLARGVYTGSAGNMAQGLAYNARRLGLTCRIVVPEGAPRTKLDAITRLGARYRRVPFDEWWSVLRDHGHPDEEGFFVHPVSDPAVIAGNGTVGLEILEDAPDVAAVVVPFGGGGLSCGIATAIKARRPDVRVYAAEVETAAPLAASLAAGAPVEIHRVPSFVDGIGGKGVLPEMWPLASRLLDGSLVQSVAAICDATRALVTHAHVIAEGAGACAVAAALSGQAGDGDVVAVVSGGNIDTDVLCRILAGGVPE